MLKVLWVLDPANTKLGLKLYHGPDGNLSTVHSVPIGAVLPSAVPGVMSGDTDPAKMIGEFLHPVLLIQGPVAGPAQRATVEVFELRKTF